LVLLAKSLKAIIAKNGDSKKHVRRSSEVGGEKNGFKLTCPPFVRTFEYGANRQRFWC
jgi:hypothetical protein